MIDLDVPPTLWRIFRLLSDGKPHSKEEIRKLLNDDLTGDNTIQVHMRNLRLRLPPNLEIVCLSLGKAVRYRMVRPYIPE